MMHLPSEKGLLQHSLSMMLVAFLFLIFRSSHAIAPAGGSFPFPFLPVSSRQCDYGFHE